MTDLPTIGLISITDGRLMGDIGDVYEVVSHFIGRGAYTHELPKYGRLAAPVIRKHFPKLPVAPDMDWEKVRDAAIEAYGERVEVPAEWAGSLADGKGPITNLTEALQS